MSISAANAVYAGGNAPTVTGEVKAGQNELDFIIIGQATLTGDGSLSVGQVNFIDGTKVVSPVPTKVFACRIGGDATATIGVASCNEITGAKFACQFTAAPGNGATVIIAFFAAR
jgi:hypothetical protein